MRTAFFSKICILYDCVIGDLVCSLLFVVDFAEGTAGDEGDGDGGDAFELHDDVLVALDALNGALHSGKVAVDDLYTFAFLVEEVVGLEEHDGVVTTGGHKYDRGQVRVIRGRFLYQRVYVAGVAFTSYFLTQNVTPNSFIISTRVIQVTPTDAAASGIFTLFLRKGSEVS